MIRKLNLKDVNDMLEWMHDVDVVEFLDKQFVNKTKEDCVNFILSANQNNAEHFAITDESREYLGTVSLKNIDLVNKKAEMAIVLRKCAMGKGISEKALDDIFEFGFNKYGIKTYYWYVNKMNIRAIRFYDKHRYNRIDHIKEDDESKYIFYSHQYIK